MKPKILVVEDNIDVLMNLSLLLQFNDYTVITARNGVEALDILNRFGTPPDLILSDIMMPKMDGYDLFLKISEKLEWNLIPFIFLTAKDSPEDIRFGKKLGVDDYITKPFREEDLLASVMGKIKRGERLKSLGKRIEKKLLTSLHSEKTDTLKNAKDKPPFLFLMLWDEDYGPELKDLYPTESYLEESLTSIGIQLFQITVSIFGQAGDYRSEGVLLRISNIDMSGYLYFDSIHDSRVRGGQRQFMLATLAPYINYFESLRIEEVLKSIAKKLKTGTHWNIRNYCEKIYDILAQPFSV